MWAVYSGVDLGEESPEDVRSGKDEAREMVSASACCQTEQAMMEADAVEVKGRGCCRGGLKGSCVVAPPQVNEQPQLRARPKATRFELRTP